MRAIPVALTEEDRDRAHSCATRRVRDAVGVGARDRLGRDSEESHYWGALGEIVVAKYLGIPWSCSSMVWATEDVAGFEVRSVPPGTRLYIKAKGNDPAERRIVLVAHVDGCTAMLMGWMTAAEVRAAGRLEDWGQRGAPAYMLTTLSLLHDMAS